MINKTGIFNGEIFKTVEFAKRIIRKSNETKQVRINKIDEEDYTKMEIWTR